MKKLGVSLAFILLFIYAGASAVSAESYKVQEGDSLWEIADEYDTTVNELMDINGLKTSVIQPKQELTIYETYVVEKGDTLSGIAEDYDDVTVDDLKKWNDLDSHIIQIDQELKIKDIEADDNANKEQQTQSTEKKEKKSEKPKAKAEKEQEKTAQQETESYNDDSPEGKTIQVTATAYTAKCDGCSGVTSTGVGLNATPDAKVIAVDPGVSPLGTKVYVE